MAFVVVACSDADQPIWTQQSQTVEIGWFEFFEGGYRFERDRSQLTALQVGKLQAIRTIDASSNCPEDEAGASVTITDTNGSVHEYGADELGARCTDNRTYVAYGQVEALLETADCLSAKNYQGDALDDAPHIAVGDGCSHGLFNGSETTPDWWFLVDVTTPGQHRFATHACGDRQLRLSLFDAAGVTQLAAAEPDGGGDCTVLACDVSEAGPHALHVEMLGGRLAGDFYLSADRLP
jgi:hypothetical protein